MEENNLNVAPTEQELDNAGFELLAKTYYKQVTKFTSIYVASDLSKCELVMSGIDEEIELTKQKINDAFALFNQPLPQWEKPKPKVGEVWKDSETVYLINIILNKTIRVTVLFNSVIPTGTLTNVLPDTLTKLADSLEDYYKKKFLQNCTDWANKNEELNDRLKQQESQIEKAHEYSYKGLKAKGKIPHDRSGEDHDSIEAFKKLLAICEALNGMFEKDDSDNKYCPVIDWELHIDIGIVNYQDESPVFFTSKEAFEAFRSAPENVELFKTFLKIK